MLSAVSSSVLGESLDELHKASLLVEQTLLTLMNSFIPCSHPSEEVPQVISPVT